MILDAVEMSSLTLRSFLSSVILPSVVVLKVMQRNDNRFLITEYATKRCYKTPYCYALCLSSVNLWWKRRSYSAVAPL
jgi:hypothetical protein